MKYFARDSIKTSSQPSLGSLRRFQFRERIRPNEVGYRLQLAYGGNRLNLRQKTRLLHGIFSRFAERLL